MAQLYPFIIEHWLLSSSFVILLILFLINEWRCKAQSAAALSPQQLVDMMNRRQAVVLDIRETDLYVKGHILGAVNVPHQQITEKNGKLNKYKNKPVVVVCAQGLLAAKVTERLKSTGFTQVYKLAGGMAAWQQDQLPINKAKS